MSIFLRTRQYLEQKGLYKGKKKEQEDERQGRLRPLITGKIKSDDPKRVVKVEAELLA